ncbi:LPS export ABC transporter periplasmic protein LptC [Sphingomonas montana]|uniref:LPS export ABC transporter periplasmic protein LptC n=1 Tax=Sphingomonas montana TaxID=1843236 RepID=UPI00096CB383|nr:LPS export ABC transporter periplasmic protein LptC [Sphingomonas montana]
MSEAGVRARSRRQQWAARGGSHDRLIGFLRVALPMAIGVLFVLLATAPLLGGRDVSFVLAKDRVEVARERMRVTEANYRGQDAKGQPFQLRAASAVQQTSRDPVVRMDDLSARIALDDGPATIVARKGRYDMDSEKVAIDGQVLFSGANGYRMQTRDVTVDLKTRKIASGGPVDGKADLGTFQGGHLTGDLNTRVVNLTNGVRLQIPRRGTK